MSAYGEGSAHYIESAYKFHVFKKFEFYHIIKLIELYLINLKTYFILSQFEILQLLILRLIQINRLSTKKKPYHTQFMNPSQKNNNSRAFMENSNQFNNFSNPISYSQFNLPSQKSEQQEQFLLDGVLDNSTFPLAKDVVRKQTISNSFFNETKYEKFVPQPFSTIMPQSKQPITVKPQNIKERISKLDEDLEYLMRLNQKPQENISKNKVPTQNEEKNRKTISRLSQQFFAKSGPNTSESAIKSKIKSRRTVSGFGNELGNKNKDQQKKTSQQVLQAEKSQNQDVQKDLPNDKPQKMEIQQPIQNEINKIIPHEESKIVIEARLSQVKRQRDRLSIGRENLFNLIRNIDEQEKRKELKMQNQKKRITIDMFTINKLISDKSDGEQEKKPESSINDKQSSIDQNKLINQTKESTSISNKPKRMTEYLRPVQPEKVILEDEKQDQFTPLKTYFKSGAKCQVNNQFLYLSQFTQKKPEIEQVKKIDYQKQVFKNFFQKVKEKVALQRKVVENLRRQKQELLKNSKKSLSQFRIDSKKLNEIRQSSQIIQTQIAQLKMNINSSDYLQYRKIINSFQVKFGIKLHTYQQISKGSGKNSSGEGFFVQFTYQNILLRVKRGDRDEAFAMKVQPYTMLRNQDIFTFKFDYQMRTQLYQQFITKKLKKAVSFLPFMVNFISYCNALTQFQLTMEYNIHLYSIEYIQLNDTKLEIEFQVSTCNKYNFLCTVELLKLRGDGGVTIIENDKVAIKIPEEVLKWKLDGNKIQNCFDFLNEYSNELACKQIDEEIERITKSAK